MILVMIMMTAEDKIKIRRCNNKISIFLCTTFMAQDRLIPLDEMVPNLWVVLRDHTGKGLYNERNDFTA
jgi:hypothetical protein